jgi:hypothetical protein
MGPARGGFHLMKSGEYEPYTSLYAAGEIDDEPNQKKRQNMRNLITDCSIKVREPEGETDRLTALYLNEKAVPESQPTDAAHTAIAAVGGLDFIVSLNFTHIARPWAIERVRRVNGRETYKGIGIYGPGRC